MISFPSTVIEHKNRSASQEHGGSRDLPSSNNEKLYPKTCLENSSNAFSSNEKDIKAFGKLYDQYSPKIFGFLSLYCKTKDQAEKYLIDIFLKVWDEVKDFNDAEKKINRILLVTCRPLFKNAISK